MKKQLWVLSLLAMSYHAGLAVAADTPSLGQQLEGIGKKAAEDTVKAATPNEVKQGVKAVEEAADKAKATKEAVEHAPATLEGQAKDSAEKAVKQAVPQEAKEGTKEAAEIAGKVRKAPKEASKAAKSAKRKTEKGIVDGAKSLLP